MKDTTDADGSNGWNFMPGQITRWLLPKETTATQFGVLSNRDWCFLEASRIGQACVVEKDGHVCIVKRS